MIKLIVAVAENGVIGKGNDLPWHYPEDLRYFKAQTLNQTVLMGEATFLSIIDRLGKPLPKRKTIVASLNPKFSYPGVTVINDLETFLKTTPEDIIITGGRMIYELALPYVDELLITHIHKAYDGDCKFPDVPWDKFEKVKSHRSGDLEFAVYRRKS